MNANARNFEAEIEAQHIEEPQRARKLHKDAVVVPATAL